ncbi:MAG: double zinc ribbon domain-containing protein, partial [Lentisphaerota bacterium]
MGRKWAGLLDLVFPRMCEVCGGRLQQEKGHLCWDCLAKLRYVQPPYCSLCGDPIAGRVDVAFTCWQCSREKPHFVRARSAARYDGPLKDLLRQFKYRNSLFLRRDLVDILYSCASIMEDVECVDAVTYVPLYPSRQRERTYNQAELLAEALAKCLRKPLIGRILRRTKPTPS